jgi:hypothetical protein
LASLRYKERKFKKEINKEGKDADMSKTKQDIQNLAMSLLFLVVVLLSVFGR